MSDSFKNRLQQLLDENTMKPVDLANAIKAPKSRISQWMHNKTSPNSDSLHDIASLFNVSEAWLMGYDVPKQFSHSNLQTKIQICDMVEKCYGSKAREAVRRFLLLNDEGQERIIEEIELLLQSPKYQAEQNIKKASRKKKAI